MNLKLFLFELCFIGILISNPLNAQKWQAEFSTGYSWPIVAEPAFTIAEEITSTSDIVNLSSKKFGYANGLNSRLNLNYQLKKGLYLSLGTNYLQSLSNKESESKREYFSDSISDYSNEYSKWKHSFLDVHLGLALENDLNSKLSFYFSAGPVLNLIGKSTNNFHSIDEYSYNSALLESTVVNRVTQNKSYGNLGFYSDLGITYKLKGKWQLFFLGTIRSRSYILKSSKMTEYTINGTDQLASMTVADKETNFVDSYSTTTTPDENVPSTDTKSGISNGSFGLLVGMRFQFGKTIEELPKSDSLSKFYIQAGGGFGFNYNGSHLSETDVSLLGGSTVSAVPYSYGSGMNFSLQCGWRLKDNFSLELGGMYNMAKISFTNSINGTNPFFVLDGNDERNNEASMIRILTGFRMERNSDWMGIYIRSGFSLGMAARIIESTDSELETGTSGSTFTVVNESTTEYSGGLSFGLYGAIGFVWNLNPTIGIFTEANFIAQNWLPQSSKLTRFNINGTDQLSLFDIADKEINYVTGAEIDANAPYNPDEPAIELARSHPFSGLVISLGVRVNLGK